MILSFGIKNLIKQKSGKRLQNVADCEFLVHDIFSVTGEQLSLNTIKRLLGFLSDDRVPRMSTLDIIAQYLGFADWSTLSQLDARSNSSFGEIEGELRINDLSVGVSVEVAYLPDRQIRFKYVGNSIFEVIDSVNSKLQVGDSVEIRHIVKGFPLFAVRVVRAGNDLGSLTAGKISGLTSVKLL